MEFEREQILKRLSTTGTYETHICTPEEIGTSSFRRWVNMLLWTQPILIEFEKVDGTTRVMECTLSENFGAKHKPLEDTSTYPKELVLKESAEIKQKNEVVCSVWDIKKSGWRSFRWDRIKKIDFKTS